MTLQLLSQKMSQQAFDVVDARLNQKDAAYCEKYISFAKSFPALTHSCGLAQAVAFAQAKQKLQQDYLDDLRIVLNVIGHNHKTVEALSKSICTSSIDTYLRLSRNVLQASTWIKRYVEAVDPPTNRPVDQPEAQP